MAATPTTLGTGRILVDAWAASLAACWRLARGRVSLSPCLELGAGMQTGTGRGFTLDNDSATRPFLWVGPALLGTFPVLADVEAAISAGMAVNLWHQEYYVPAAGPTGGSSSSTGQSQAAVGVFLGVGLGTSWALGGR